MHYPDSSIWTDVFVVLCEAGGREVASAPVVHPTNADFFFNGWLPLHTMLLNRISQQAYSPLSTWANAFRLLLRLYPEAAGVEAGAGQYKTTPYQLAVDKQLPAYYRRLLLRAAPDLDPAELRRLNWAERRMAMYVAHATVAKTRLLLGKLRVANKDLLKHVVSYL